MRRVTTVLGGLVMAGTLALGLSGSAWAAHGWLKISGKTHYEPRTGCYTGVYVPLSVDNYTDTAVHVYSGVNCQGDYLGTVEPDSHGFFEYGRSVYVPQ
ncbi:hypothetical protein [Streptomyces niveus]|uniref:Uncharacterized protein n=1 Tax=Streptomyces niveus TaxID=193462 RepID=A0ABZ2A397_STRNV|nr:hypothetical protein [Streptomyces niveus]